MACVGCRLGYLTLRGAQIQDLSFSDCVSQELELGTGEANRLTCGPGEIKRLLLAGASLRDVDLRGAVIAEIEEVAGLRGATISPAQLLELAPMLAREFGIHLG